MPLVYLSAIERACRFVGLNRRLIEYDYYDYQPPPLFPNLAKLACQDAKVIVKDAIAAVNSNNPYGMVSRESYCIFVRNDSRVEIV